MISGTENKSICLLCGPTDAPVNTQHKCEACMHLARTYQRLIQTGAMILDPPDFWGELGVMSRHYTALEVHDALPHAAETEA